MIKYCGKKLSKEEIIHRRKKARQYFEALGINPDIKGSMYQERRLDMRPKIHNYNPSGTTRTSRILHVRLPIRIRTISGRFVAV